MLQVFQDVDLSKPEIKQQSLLLGTAAEVHVANTSNLIEKASCVYYTPLNLMIAYDTLGLLNVVHPRPHCAPFYALGGEAVKLTLRQEVSKVSAKLGLSSDQLPVLFPVIFLLVFFLFIMRMLLKIVFPASTSSSSSRKARRPELESWNRGVLAWLYVDFVDEWIARWGHSMDADKTRIQIDELGLLGDPEDDCDRCYERLEKLWSEEVQTVGIEKANLIKVCCRYITWPRIIALGVWTGIYEAFMYIGPPLSMSLLINVMDDIYVTRIQGGYVEPADLLPATIIAIMLFTGIPVCCGISNTFTSLFAMRISLRVDGALSCLAYRKAQRLPTSSQIELFDNDGMPSSRPREEAEQSGSEGEPSSDDFSKQDTSSSESEGNTSSEEAEEGGSIDPSKFNLVQVVSNDINDSIMVLPKEMAKSLVTFPIVLILFAAVSIKIGATILVCILACMLLTIVMFAFGAGVVEHSYNFMFWSGKRLQFLEELFFNIQTVKSCGWESMSKKRALDMREKELTELRGIAFNMGGCWTCILQLPHVVLMIALWGYMLLNGKTQVSGIWTLLPLLFAFQSSFLMWVGAVPAVVNALPSVYRLQGFLKLREAPNGVPRSEEVPPWMEVWPETQATIENPSLLADTTMQVRVQGNFSWKSSLEPALKDIDIAIPAGKSVGVLGKVGSGKTSLLMAMLGELHPKGDSRITVPKRMAFSAQTPCILEGTLQNNILFASPLDQDYYNECIHASGLFPDLEVLPGGHNVPIGSRGISLSGGQKARVSMARAAYMNTPLVIVDDPFSALDSRTGLHILDNYVFGETLKGITRVIVTQPDTERIKRFDQVVLLSNGRIVVQGTPAEVMKTDEYRALLNSHQMSDLDGEKKVTKKDKVDVGLKKQTSGSKTVSEAFALREEEFEGRVQWSNVFYFVKVGGYWNTFLVIFGFLGIMACQLLSKVALQDWSTQQMLYSANAIEVMPSGFNYFWPFLFWWTTSVVWYWYCYYHGIKFTVNMSRHTLEDIISTLLHAPIDFFYNKTPVGRIMNRLTTDLMNIDRNTFSDISTIISIFWQEVVPIAYVHILMPIYFTIASIPLYVFLVLIVRRYANTMIPMRYLTHVSKSCTDMCLTEVDMSLPVLRGMQATDKKFTEFMEKLGAQIRAEWGTQTFVKRWVIQRLFLLIGFYMTFMMFICIWVPGTLSFGALGLCLANMLQVCVSIEDDMEYFARAQFQLISMNRIHEYTKLPQEKPNLVAGDDRFTDFTVEIPCESLSDLLYDKDTSGNFEIWIKCKTGTSLFLIQKEGTETFIAPGGKNLSFLQPGNDTLKRTEAWHRITEVNTISGKAGAMAEELCSAAESGRKKVRLHIKSGWIADGARVVMRNLVAGYGDIPRDILKDVSLLIEPCTNVGFVGATGCGKSTLLLCMLRILEPRGGTILINDVNIGNIGLQTLRASVGLVPQDPVLMNASVRDNLDPFSFHDDTQLWEALNMVGLMEEVEKMPEGMETTLSGDGAHLSFGQRQLLCMARLVVQQPSLILLDEATSALDPKTQEVVQKTVESRFPKSTLMVVAHRLETILNFDKVVVMDNGQVAEQGSVEELRAVKGGMFAKMLAAKQTW